MRSPRASRESIFGEALTFLRGKHARVDDRDDDDDDDACVPKWRWACRKCCTLQSTTTAATTVGEKRGRGAED